MARLPIGARIRDRRRACGLTQSGLAAAAGISASYLNLIEHDKRPIGGALLRRIAELLESDIGQISGADDMHLALDLLELTRSLGGEALQDESALALVARFPDWAQAFVRLHRRYREATESALALSDRLSQDPALLELSHAVLSQVTAIRSFAEILEVHGDLAAEERSRFSKIIANQSDQLAASARQMLDVLGSAAGQTHPSTPREEVDDFLMAHRNHFPRIEAACDDLRADFRTAGTNPAAAIEELLARRHNLELSVSADLHRPIVGPGRLLIPEGTPETTVRFLQARSLAEAELAPLLDELTQDPQLTSDQARGGARMALARYAAGALRFPYAPFLEAAETLRYDVEWLAARFGGSFEQVAHRLVTLRRPGAAGVPFAFLRSDPAGNLSKPLSLPELRMPRLGGACPLWVLHRAFALPDRPVAQLVELPGDERYLFVARCVTKTAGPYGSPPVTFSVMLGCDAVYLDRIVYGDGFAGHGTRPTAVGFNCRSCRREDCAQRAHPAVLPHEASGEAPHVPGMSGRKGAKDSSREEKQTILAG